MKQALTALVLLAGVLALPASATPPGKNGQIAFTRYAVVSGGDAQSGSIYTIGVDGKGERRVTKPPAGASDEAPDWSPDGSRIVFTRAFDDKPFEIWSVRPDGSDPRRIDPGCPPGIPASQICEEDKPAWSPDGRRIAFANPHGKLADVAGEEWIDFVPLAVMSADGSNLRHLTKPKRHAFEDSQPVWSPDGSRIAFMRWNGMATPRDKLAIFVLDVASGKARRLTPWGLNAGDHPDWSPDGRRILFRSQTAGRQGPIYTVRPDGTGLKRLTHFKPGVELFSSSFSPDGTSIVFSRTGTRGLPDLFVMRSNGTSVRQLTRTRTWDSHPDWGPAR